MKYKVNWDYRAYWRDEPVILTAGSVVDLEDEVAAFIGRDSPGAISPVEKDWKPGQDRMVREAETRAEYVGEDADEAPAAGGLFQISGLKADQELALLAAGYDTLAALSEATDEALLAVDSIGEKTLLIIRNAIAERHNYFGIEG